MAKIVIYGAGKVADVADDIFADNGEHEVVGFAVDDAWHQDEAFKGRPLVKSSALTSRFEPADHHLFLAVGYHQINQLRAKIFSGFDALGFKPISCISHRAWCAPSAEIGENALIMPGAVVEPGVTLGQNVVVWSNATIGHHSSLGDYVWVSGNAIIGGAASLGDRCFVTLGAVVGNETKIGAGSMLGAGSLTTKCQDDESVVIARDTEKFRLSAPQFLKITKLK